MHPALVQLRDIASFEQLLTESASRPLLLFKHSTQCGTSAYALDELIEHLERDSFDACYAVVTVQTDRQLSAAVASRLGVRHETPQALLIRDSAVVWSATHHRVTAKAVREALAAHAALVR